MSEIRVRNLKMVLDELDRCPKGFTFDILGKIENDGVVKLRIIKAHDKPDLVNEKTIGYIGSFTKPSDYDWPEREGDEFIKWFSERLHHKYDVEVIQ